MQSPEELARRNIEGLDALKEFQRFVTPDDGRKFTELYNVQHLQSSQLDKVSRVCISTIQRLYSMLRSLIFWVRNTDATGPIHARRQATLCARATRSESHVFARVH